MGLYWYFTEKEVMKSEARSELKLRASDVGVLSLHCYGLREEGQSIRRKQGSCQPCLWAGSVSRAQPHEAGYPADKSPSGLWAHQLLASGLTPLTLSWGQVFTSVFMVMLKAKLSEDTPFPSFLKFLFIGHATPAFGILVH